MITEQEDDGARNEGIYRLGDAKSALDIMPDDDSENANIALWIEEAQAILEESTGLCLSPMNVTAEFTNPSMRRVQCLELTESDFGSITSVEEVDGAGNIKELSPSSYETFRALRRYFIRRTDNECFPYHCYGVVAKVQAVRRVKAGTRMARMARAAMNHLVVEKAKGLASTSPQGFADNPSYIRIIRLLRSNTRTASVM